jgi:hypothetical protein
MTPVALPAAIIGAVFLAAFAPPLLGNVPPPPPVAPEEEGQSAEGSADTAPSFRNRGSPEQCCRSSGSGQLEMPRATPPEPAAAASCERDAGSSTRGSQQAPPSSSSSSSSSSSDAGEHSLTHRVASSASPPDAPAATPPTGAPSASPAAQQPGARHRALATCVLVLTLLLSNVGAGSLLHLALAAAFVLVAAGCLTLEQARSRS